MANHFPDPNFIAKLKEALDIDSYEESAYSVIEMFSALIENQFKSAITPEEVLLIRNAVYGTKIAMSGTGRNIKPIEVFVDFLLGKYPAAALKLATTYESEKLSIISFWMSSSHPSSWQDAMISPYSRLFSIATLISYGFDFDRLFTF